MNKVFTILFCLLFANQLLFAQTTFTFNIGNGTDNFISQTTAEWIESGHTLSFSVTGGGTASPLGQYDGILGSSGYTESRWTVTNGTPPYNPITITISISGKVFDLTSLDVWDEATAGHASYSILTSKGGSYSYNFPARTGDEDLINSHSYSGTNFSEISSFTITFNTGSSSIAAVSLDNLVLKNIITPLPVELTSFKATMIDKKVKLNWQTAAEVNNYGFEIERIAVSDKLLANSQQLNTNSWVKIGFVKGNGNSNSPKSYSFTDKPTGGTEFSYRLKQIDLDGQYKYSDVVNITLAVPTNFAVEQNYPNPFNPTTSIQYQVSGTSNVTLKIYDVLGKEVATLVNETKVPGKYEVKFDGSNLSSGIYFYKLTAGDFIQTKKLILMK
jgi:hypothetical protein